MSVDTAPTKTETISDQAAKDILENLQHARITQAYIESRIESREFLNPEIAPQLTICVLKLNNGFCVVGESAPASPENFNADLGQKYAYDNAFKKLWPMFGFTLCEVLHGPGASEGRVLQGL